METRNRIQKRFLVSGRVQGVGFRYATQTFVASSLPSIQGWVRNLEDGQVEVMAQGTPEDLEILHNYLWRGPPRSRVDNIRMTEEPIVENELPRHFRIRH